MEPTVNMRMKRADECGAEEGAQAGTGAPAQGQPHCLFHPTIKSPNHTRLPEDRCWALLAVEVANTSSLRNVKHCSVHWRPPSRAANEYIKAFRVRPGGSLTIYSQCSGHGRRKGGRKGDHASRGIKFRSSPYLWCLLPAGWRKSYLSHHLGLSWTCICELSPICVKSEKV